MLRSAAEHERAQERVQRSALTQARALRTAPSERLWRVLTSWQAVAALTASRWLPEMLAEQGITAEAVAPLILASQAGTASDGRSLRSLLEYAARESTSREFDTIVATQLQDVARSTLATDIATRPTIDGYARQITAGACSRCAILAGRFYRWNEGFDRHPNCNCEHIPTTREAAGDVTTSPRDYFDSLDEAEQDRIFTKAGAEAIRMGADPVAVVNARRGMETAQPIPKVIGHREFHLDIAGQRITAQQPILAPVESRRARLVRNDAGLFVTEEGTSRGRAFQSLSQGGVTRETAGTAIRHTRTGAQQREVTRSRATTARLMPESILELSGGDRDQALTLLQRHGYIR